MLEGGGAVPLYSSQRGGSAANERNHLTNYVCNIIFALGAVWQNGPFDMRTCQNLFTSLRERFDGD